MASLPSRPVHSPPAAVRAGLAVAVIGAGSRSQIALRVADALPGSRVVAAVDTAEYGRERARALFGNVAVYSSLSALIEAGGIDAAIVTTPDATHVAVATELLQAGVAVYLEKPLAITVEGADAVLTTAAETGTPLYVGHNFRHSGVVRALRDVVGRGEIGEVKTIWCRHFVGNGGDFYFKDWHAERRNVNSLLLQKASHDIDVIHFLAGGYTRRVVGMGDLMVYGQVTDRGTHPGETMEDWLSLDNWPPEAQTRLNPTIDVEDVSMMMMTLDNGVLASYQQCHFTPDYWRNYTVIGDAGRIENFGDGPGDRIGLWNRRHEGYAEPDETVQITGDDSGHGGADQQMMAEFLRFVRHGGRTDTSPIAARQAVAAAVTATRSLRGDGSALPVPALDPALVAYFDGGQPSG